MADYEHPLVSAEDVGYLYDLIFSGEINRSLSKLPFNFVAAALNGTNPLPEVIGEDIHLSRRYGVFVEPYERRLNLPFALLSDVPRLPSYKELLTLVERSIVNKDTVPLLPRQHLSTMDELREFFVSHHDLKFPMAVISEWHVGEDRPEDKNLCMHYPEIVDPIEVHDFLRCTAQRKRLLLGVDDAIKVEIVGNTDNQRETLTERTVQIGERALIELGYGASHW